MILCAAFFAALSFFADFSVLAAEADGYERANLFVNNEFYEEAGIIKDGVTLVPIRLINNALGLTTEWRGKESAVTIDFGNGNICDMRIGENTVHFAGMDGKREFVLGVPPMIAEVNGEDVTVLPVRFISEELGLDVIWEGGTKTVFINSSDAHNDYIAESAKSAVSENAPDALMYSYSGDEITVPYGEIEDNRRVGWFVKRFSLGLDALAERINNFIAGKSGKWGVYVKNLDTDEYLLINDGCYSSASIIKLFVMAETYNEIAYGSVKKSARVDELLWYMITESDNYASNQLVKINGGGSYKSGFDAENAHSASIGAINTQHMSLFSGYGDYVAYGRNLVSPYDCGITLEKIYRGELVSEEYSAEMLNLLKNQQRKWKIPYPLPHEIVTANKTGENSSVESDIAIVYSPECDYIICVLTNNAGGAIDGIRQISRMTYDYFNP